MPTKKITRTIAIKKRALSVEVFNFISLRRGVKERHARSKYKELFTYSLTNTLNKSQQKVATSFAAETLVIAGAGTGKTSALLGRSKYLITDERVKGEETLLLAFNKKAAEEISERAKKMKLEVTSRTFHGFARQILAQSIKEHGLNSPSDFNTLESIEGIAFSKEEEISKFIGEFVDSYMRKNASQLLEKYFSLLMVPHYNHETFKSIEDYAQFVRSGIPVTLAGERVKSHGEWLIANFLFCNQVPYKYEGPHEESKGTGLWYRPDFSLFNGRYIEYFGIDKNSKTLPWIDSQKYIAEMESKIETHKKRNTSLIELTYQDLLDNMLVQKLKQNLESLSIPLRPLNNEAILVAANKVGYTNKFIELSKKFLGFYRAANYEAEVILSKCRTEREQIFMQIFCDLYDSYLEILRCEKQTDFTGLILEATKILNSTKKFTQFRHVLVDEFQDISKDRWNLIEGLRKSNPEIEFTFVGDDWQAINEFAGSDPEIMINLGNWNKKREQIFLADTFRMPQTLCEASGEFIMQNTRQIPKQLVAKGDTAELAQSLFFHWDTDVSDQIKNINSIIERIGHDRKDTKSELFILARINRTLPKLSQVDQLWAGPVYLSTIHRAKGLEADYVIVLDVNSAGVGFPSQIQDDPLLDLVRDKDLSVENASERRVFYVALTRARKATHVASSISAPSSFALEMQKASRGIHIAFEESKIANCPSCLSGWLIKKEKIRGLSCTNWPVCRYKTPACLICGESTSIDDLETMTYKCANHPVDGVIKCPKCEWGAFEVKSGKNGLFLGCHLWSSSGCRGTQNIDDQNSLQPLPKIVTSEPLSRKGKKWSLEEDRSVVKLLNNGKTINEVADSLERKTSAIKARLLIWLQASDMRLHSNSQKKSTEYERNQEAWNIDESKKLELLWQKGDMIDEIADILKRPVHQIVSELFDIGLISINSEHLKVIDQYYESKMSKGI